MSKIWGSFDCPISSWPECERLFREFTSRLSRNEEQPLGEGDTLNICSTSSFSFLSTEKYPVSGNDISITLAAERSRHPGLDSCTVQQLVITLSAPFRIGRGCRSQVWKAVALGEVPIVVKIFQACFYEPPQWNSSKKVVMDFIPEEEMAHREAWSYSELAHLQGSRIPHSYGFFDIKLPSGDIACAHILEFIDGMSLDKFLEKLPSRGAAELGRPLLADYVVDTVIEFQRQNLTHGDIEGRNIICPNRVLGKAVVIDFDSAQNILECSRRMSPARDIWFLLITILGWRGAQSWTELKAEQSISDPSWREILLQIRGKDKWEPFAEREREIAEEKDRRNEEALAAS